MGITIQEALQNSLISEDTLRLLPKICECGHELVFSDSLRYLYCDNSECKRQLKERVKAFYRRLNIDISDINIELIIKELNIVIPYQLLMIDEADKHGLLDNIKNNRTEKLVADTKKIKSKSYFCYEIAEMCGIDYIVDVAKKIFSGFESFEDAYDEIEIGQIPFINERLGIKDIDNSILSIKIYNKLIDLKEELIFAETQLPIKEYDKEIIRIAFCDNIYPYVNKSELIDQLNYRYEYRFMIVSSINNKVDILVRNHDGNNAKYRAAKLINDKHSADLINNNNVDIDSIGLQNQVTLKPLGHVIYIDSLENIIEKLDWMDELTRGL